MQASDGFQQPHWLPRYLAQAGNFSTIDNGTLDFLSKTFGCLPVVLVPADYSVPFPSAEGLGLAIPPPPLPEARAHEEAGLAEMPVTLAELEGALGGTAATQEAELNELSQWFNGLSPRTKQHALASVAKTLSFPTGPPPLSVLPMAQSPKQPVLAPAPAFTVYADAVLTVPTAASAVAPITAARPAPLADRTNLQWTGAKHGSSKAANLKQLSSKLHVAHSQKMALQPLPAKDIQALLDYQLHSSEPVRPPWWRGNQPRSSAPSKHTGGDLEGLKPAAQQPVQAPAPTAGSGACATPGVGTHVVKA